MIEILDRSEIDDNRWNDRVKSSTHFRHYALTYFLDSSCTSWKGVIVNDYEWVWPIPIKKRIVSQVFQPLLAQQLGPFGADRLNNDILSDVWELLVQRYWNVNVKFNESVSIFQNSATKEHTNIELSLSGEYELIEKGYNRNVRSNLKKAKEATLIIDRNITAIDSVIDMFKMGRGQTLSILNDEFYLHVKRVFIAFQERGEAEIYSASRNGKVIGSIIVLNSNNRILNFFTAASNEARGIGAMHAIIDHIIKTYCNHSSVLDFEGSNDENLAYFYQSFGGDQRVYLQAFSKWHIPQFRL